MTVSNPWCKSFRGVELVDKITCSNTSSFGNDRVNPGNRYIWHRTMLCKYLSQKYIFSQSICKFCAISTSSSLICRNGGRSSGLVAQHSLITWKNKSKIETCHKAKNVISIQVSKSIVSNKNHNQFSRSNLILSLSTIVHGSSRDHSCSPISNLDNMLWMICLFSVFRNQLFKDIARFLKSAIFHIA